MMSEPLGEFHDLDTASCHKSYLLECHNGAQFKVSETARFILTAHWSGESFGAIASSLEIRSLAKATAEDVEAYYNALIEKITAAAAKYRQVPAGYSIQCELIPQPLVASMARCFTWMYDRGVALGMLAAVAVAVSFWLALYRHVPISEFGTANFLIAYVLFLGSLLPHELGHASACVRFRAKPGAIGFVLYLTFPALYSDVSSTWKITRWQRLVVDLAGSYFQLVVASLYVLLYALLKWEPLNIAVLMIFATTLFNLNPLFKFDGYWAISDVLGIPNLLRYSRKFIWKSLVSLARGRRPETDSWPTWVTYCLIVYSIAAIGAWSYFISMLVVRLPLVLERVMDAIYTIAVLRDISINTALQVLFAVLGLYIVAIFLSRLGTQLWGVAKRSLRA